VRPVPFELAVSAAHPSDYFGVYPFVHSRIVQPQEILILKRFVVPALCCTACPVVKPNYSVRPTGPEQILSEP
jgi:hypothetical protein